MMGRIALVCLPLLAILGCDGSGKTDPGKSGKTQTSATSDTPRGEGLNVWLITLDTTRQDSFACYGNDKVATPNIDRLAAEGTIFDQCISSIPITLPSHTTMMTGSYQFVHGVRDNGFFFVAEENVTLAEQFKEIGYRTEALVSAPVLEAKYGLDQGFDFYDEMTQELWVEQVNAKAKQEEGASESDAPALPEPLEEAKQENTYIYRPAAEMTEAIIPRLESLKDERFFLWTHFFDPHLPHLCPQEYIDKYPDEYLAEVAYFDDYLGKLLDKLDELKLSEKTLIILTSDHGESRGQHGEHTHSYFIYDATQRIPLIMRLPGKIKAGQRVATQVRLIDLAPTIREMVGMPNTDQTQGTSLWTLLDDPAQELNLSAYADTLTPQFSFGFSALRFVRQGGWKYVHSPEPELYNVANDELELFNIAKADPDRTTAMREALRQLIAESPTPPAGRSSNQSVDAVDLERLAALGYIGSGDDEVTAAFAEGTELDHFEPVGANPKRHLEEIELNVMAMGAMNKQDHEVAEKLYRRLLELSPDNPSHNRRLGEILLAMDRDDEALISFRRALELAPTDQNIRGVLGPIGWILMKQGKNKEALEHFKLAQDTNPREFRPYIGSAAIHLANNDWAEAAQAYEEAADRLPFDGFTWVRMAIAYRLAGDFEKSEEKLRYVLEREPDLTEARVQMYVVLDATDRQDEAEAELERALQNPDDRGRVFSMLGIMHMNKQDYPNAAEAFGKAITEDDANADAHYNLGTTYVRLQQPENAAGSFKRATELKPEFGQAWYGLARTLQVLQRYEESVPPAREAIRLRSRATSAYRVLADSLEVTGQPSEAIATLQAGVKEGVRAPLLLNDLAWRLATARDEANRDPQAALELALEALEKSRDKRNVYDTVAAAYAANGQFQEAVLAAKQAISLAQQAGLEPQVRRMQARLELYQQERPYRVN